MASCGEDRSGEYYALIGEKVWICLLYTSKIWVSTRWSESEYAEAQSLFNSLLIQVNDLSIMGLGSDISKT